jgi:glycosyltransferase involved in cell wall biosynthesis
LIALQLHRETRLPLVAHFSDPWVDSPYFRWGGIIRRSAEKWEREVVEAAARVIFVNSHTRDHVMAKYPESWKAKASVIPQSHEAGVTVAQPAITGARPMRMVYTGRFYNGIRTPNALLQALSDLHGEAPLDGRIEVEFVGADVEAYAREATRLGLDRLVIFSGRMPPPEARARAATADVLLVIDADSDSSLFLPSKLVEYLPLRRQILGLTPASGPSADLIRELGYRVTAPGDVPAIATTLRELLHAHAAGRLVPSLQHDSVTDRFSVARTTRKFAGLLQQVVDGR